MTDESPKAHDLAAEIARIIRISDERKEFVTLECGYVYFWPEGHTHGAYSPWVLRALADELDRRNAPWDAQVQAYFETLGERR